jgi:hypothetical protein
LTESNHFSCRRTFTTGFEEDHLAWFVIEAIEELDIDAFYASYRADANSPALEFRQSGLAEGVSE